MITNLIAQSEHRHQIGDRLPEILRTARGTFANVERVFEHGQRFVNDAGTSLTDYLSATGWWQVLKGEDVARWESPAGDGLVILGGMWDAARYGQEQLYNMDAESLQILADHEGLDPDLDVEDMRWELLLIAAE